MSKIVEFFTPEGEVTHYRPLSARLPAFLAVYGPERGFSVDTEIVDSLSLKPGLLKLYEIVLHAGRKPEDAGLPPLNGTGQTLVGRATLRDPAGGSWPPPRRPNPSSPTRTWRCWKPPRVSVCWRRWASVARSWTRTKPGIRPIRAGYPGRSFQPFQPPEPWGRRRSSPRRPSRTRRGLQRPSRMRRRPRHPARTLRWPRSPRGA